MAKVTGLKKSLEDKQKKEAKALRYKMAKTPEQKKFLDENPNVKTAVEMDKRLSDLKSKADTQTRRAPMGYQMAKGGRAGYKNGKSVKKKSAGAAIRGKGCEIR